MEGTNGVLPAYVAEARSRGHHRKETRTIMSDTTESGPIDNNAKVDYRNVTGKVVKLQSGYVYHYAFAMLLGAVLTAGAWWLWR